MKIPVETLKSGAMVRLEGEFGFVPVDYVAERFYEPGVFNLWIVGDKIPVGMQAGELVEVLA